MGWSGALDRMRVYRHVSGAAKGSKDTPYRFKVLTVFDMTFGEGQNCEHWIM